MYTNIDQPAINARAIGFIIVAVVMVATLGFVSYIVSQPDAFCDGAPFLYVTFHHEVSNVWKYSRNGCLLSQNVLVGDPSTAVPNHLIELRSLVLNSFNGSEALYVADAFTGDSKVNIYSKCNRWGDREFIKTAVSTNLNSGINHVYGLAFDDDGNMYASSQHTDNVLRFYKDSFLPIPFPPMMERADSRFYKNYPGTFVQFGKPNTHDLDEQGVRDIAHVNGYIWVANEDVNGITIVDVRTGLVEDIIDVEMPIGLHYDSSVNTVFVSSKGGASETARGKVLGISATTRRIVRQYQSKKMMHPTGITSYHGTLFVADQHLGQIFAFRIKSGSVQGVIVNEMPGLVEQIMLSDC